MKHAPNPTKAVLLNVSSESSAVLVLRLILAVCHFDPEIPGFKE